MHIEQGWKVEGSGKGMVFPTHLECRVCKGCKTSSKKACPHPRNL